jgi:hypothetical protein
LTVHLHDYDWSLTDLGRWVRACECGFDPDAPSWRVLVTGSHAWSDDARVWRALRDEWHVARAHGWQLVVVEGQCPYGGADKFAEDFAATMSLRHPGRVYHDPFPANWKTLGQYAGHIRNQLMVDRGADVCLAFPTIESRGTWDCVRRAEEAGIPVKVFEH